MALLSLVRRLTIVDLCRDSAMLKQAWHCARCSIGCLWSEDMADASVHVLLNVDLTMSSLVATRQS